LNKNNTAGSLELSSRTKEEEEEEEEERGG
jgi:hypothetical protein